jgi:RIO kinase 1
LHLPDPTNDESLASSPSKEQKASYESSVDVQRWLREHAVEEIARPPFDPKLLREHHDRLWLLSSLSPLYEEDYINDVLHLIQSGKEATVYCCEATPRTNMAYAAAKIYRPRMFRSLRNDAVYRQSRTQYDRDGNLQRRHRQGRKDAQNERTRAAQVRSWIDFEYKVQNTLFEAGGIVPRPLAQMGNAVLMEYIGSPYEPGVTLREVDLDHDEAEEHFRTILQNIELFLKCHYIHGDLSEYNILYFDEKVTIIDFAQAVDPRHNIYEVYALLARDVERVCRFFRRFGITSEPSALASAMWARYSL